jgi:hypothetical protein
LNIVFSSSLRISPQHNTMTRIFSI